MPKKPKPDTPLEDAFTRIDNFYLFPMGKMPDEAIKEVLKALQEAKTDKEYFEWIKLIQV